jgi:hypothetical protein
MRQAPLAMADRLWFRPAPVRAGSDDTADQLTVVVALNASNHMELATTNHSIDNNDVVISHSADSQGPQRRAQDANPQETQVTCPT